MSRARLFSQMLPFCGGGPTDCPPRANEFGPGDCRYRLPLLPRAQHADLRDVLQATSDRDAARCCPGPDPRCGQPVRHRRDWHEQHGADALRVHDSRPVRLPGSPSPPGSRRGRSLLVHGRTDGDSACHRRRALQREPGRTVASGEPASGSSPRWAPVTQGSVHAILTTYDKTGIVEFARGLVELGWTLTATSGTGPRSVRAGAPVTSLEDRPVARLFGGRVKGLHPNRFGGLLYRRGVANDEAVAATRGIPAIDLVAGHPGPHVRDGGCTVQCHHATWSGSTWAGQR